MILTEIQCQNLEKLISNSLNRLYVDDLNLIERKGMEQSIAFCFALYLREALQTVNWINDLQLDIDIEYNKNGLVPKKTPRRPNGTIPDLIIHKRGNNESNLLIVEIKGWWNKESRDVDKIKLEDFTHQDGEYRYGLGVFLELKKKNCIPIYFRGY